MIKKPPVKRQANRLLLMLLQLGVLLAFLTAKITPAVGQTNPVASPPSSTFSVNAFATELFTGSSSADIPIVVPPGTAGIAPKIVLSYNSGVVDELGAKQQGVGKQADAVGLGWNLDVGGFVLRDTKNTTGVSDDTFKIVFGDGTHDLVLINAAQGIYHTKDETFWELKYVSAGDYWTLKTKDGTIHRFGFNTNSKAIALGQDLLTPITYKYMLDEVTTSSGVSVRYAYVKQTAVEYLKGKNYDQAIYPDVITYPFYNGSLLGDAREVRFIRGPRTDWTDDSNITHMAFIEKERINSIEIKVGTALVRKYVFGYDYSIDRDPTFTWAAGAAGDLTLKSVTMFGSDGVISLPAVTFSYTGAVLERANNGLGGSVSYTYEQIDALYHACIKENTENLCQDWGVSTKPTGKGSMSPGADTPLGAILGANYSGTSTLYSACIRQNTENECQDWGASPTPTGLGNISPQADTLLGYIAVTSSAEKITLYYACIRDNTDDECQDWGASTTPTGKGSASPNADTLLGYIYTGRVDRLRHRVLTRTLSDGLGWNSTSNFVYTNPATNVDGDEFRGHAKVRSIDPLGNYTDTFFHQDDIKKGRVSQVEVRSNTGALFTRTVNTWSSTAPFPGVNFVFTSRVDEDECEGTSTCHRTSKTFAFDANGNPTQTVHLGDLATNTDDRQEVTDWAVNTASWIHRPTRTALLDGVGALQRESWLFYDNLPSGTVGTKGLVTREEARLAGPRGNAGNPSVTHGYDIYGNRTSTTDPRGCTTTTAFDAAGTFLATATNCLGHPPTSFVYHTLFGVVERQTDSNGQQTTFSYDELGRLTKVTRPLDINSTYGTVTHNYLDWGTPSLQRVQTFRTEQHGTANVIWSEEYFDGLGRVDQTRREGPIGQTILAETTFDLRGAVQATSAPRFAGENPIWTQFEYDVLGRQTRVDFPDGTHSETIYDHDLITLIDERGNIKRRHLDAYHRLVQLDEVNGAETYITTYQYDAANSLTRVTNHFGHVTTNVYDLLGRKITMVDPNMGTWTYDYWPAGDLKTQTDAKDQTLSFFYDLLGRPTSKKQGTTTHVSWTYDDPAVPLSIGRLTKVVDLAATTHFRYDPHGRVTETQRLLNGVTYTMSQIYDALDRVESETFPDNDTVTYAYNTAGWLSSVPNYIDNITYNARGQKTLLDYNNGVSTSWTYHQQNFRTTKRLTNTSGGVSLVALTSWVKTWTSSPTTPPTGFNFLYRGGICVANGTGSCVGGDSMVESGVGSAIGYIKASTGTDTVPVYRSTCYSNTSGTCTGWGLSLAVNGTAVGYLSTAAPDPQSATVPFTQSNGLLLQGLGGTASAYLWSIPANVTNTDHFYTSAGSPPSGYTADGTAAYLLETSATGTVPLYRFVNATEGRHYYATSPTPPSGYTQQAIVGYLRTTSGTGLTALYRYFNTSTGDYLLSTAATPPSGYALEATLGYLFATAASANIYQDLNYTYDEIGNAKTITDGIFTAGRTFTYDALNRLTSASGTFGTNQSPVTQTYSFDAIGRILQKGTVAYSYTDPLHPTAVTSTSDGKTYTYDANGNMFTGAGRTHTWDVDNRLEVLNGPGGSIVSKYDYAGTRVEKTSNLGTMLFPIGGYQIETNGVIVKYIRMGIENLAAKKSTGEKLFYHNDHLGGVNVITNASGLLAQLVEYDPWGKTSRSEGAGDSLRRFTGHQLDPESGLYYYGGRYYDPELGRFISPDPFVPQLDDPQSHNRYSYVVNNPVNYIDPDGFTHERKKKKKGGFFRKFFGFIAAAFIGWLTGGAVLAQYAALGAVMAEAAGAMVAGFVSGAISAGIAGGNPMLGGLYGGALALAGAGGFNIRGPILGGGSPFAPVAAGGAGGAASASSAILRAAMTGAHWGREYAGGDRERGSDFQSTIGDFGRGFGSYFKGIYGTFRYAGRVSGFFGEVEQQRAQVEDVALREGLKFIARNPAARQLAVDLSLEYLKTHPGRVLGRATAGILTTQILTGAAGLPGFATGATLSAIAIHGNVRLSIERGRAEVEDLVRSVLGGE